MTHSKIMRPKEGFKSNSSGFHKLNRTIRNAHYKPKYTSIFKTNLF